MRNSLRSCSETLTRGDPASPNQGTGIAAGQDGRSFALFWTLRDGWRNCVLLVLRFSGSMPFELARRESRDCMLSEDGRTLTPARGFLVTPDRTHGRPRQAAKKESRKQLALPLDP